jgi:hypothetical protein
MPKSASILALVSGDRRILDAHLAAVKSTMSQLVEKQFAESRNYERSRSGEPQKTGNLVYALFAHDTSRALDPQGHIHAVVANLTRDPKGTWKALWNGEIWKNNTTIGQFYHAAFRAQLQKLGYETEAAGKHGSFEIKGVPAEVIKAFSTRTNEIEAKIAETGATSLATKKQITLYTRDPKLVGRGSRRAGRRLAATRRRTWLRWQGAGCRRPRRGPKSKARPTFRETATAAIGEVATRINAALRTPSPLAVSGRQRSSCLPKRSRPSTRPPRRSGTFPSAKRPFRPRRSWRARWGSRSRGSRAALWSSGSANWCARVT